MTQTNQPQSPGNSAILRGWNVTAQCVEDGTIETVFIAFDPSCRARFGVANRTGAMRKAKRDLHGNMAGTWHIVTVEEVNR